MALKAAFGGARWQNFGKAKPAGAAAVASSCDVVHTHITVPFIMLDTDTEHNRVSFTKLFCCAGEHIACSG